MTTKDELETVAKAATPHADLIAQIMDSRVTKDEMGWAAAREIECLRGRAEKAEAKRDARRGMPEYPLLIMTEDGKTTDLDATIRQARREAFEEAARVADDYPGTQTFVEPYRAIEEIAAAIRAMKP